MCRNPNFRFWRPKSHAVSPICFRFGSIAIRMRPEQEIVDSPAGTRLAISEQSIVVLVREYLENQYDRADPWRGLHRIHTTIRQRQFAPPRIGNWGRQPASGRELARYPIFRDLVACKRVLLQSCDPPFELLSLFGLEFLLSCPRTRPQPDLACGETRQVIAPPTSRQLSRVRVRCLEST